MNAKLTHTLIQRKAVSLSGGSRGRAKTGQVAGVHPDLSVMINSNPNKELWLDYCGAHDHSTSIEQTRGTLNKLERAEEQGRNIDAHGVGLNVIPRRVVL